VISLTERRDGIVLVMLGTIAWSASGLLVRLLPFDPWSITAGRAGLGVLTLAPYLLWRPGSAPPRARFGLRKDGLRVSLYTAAAILLWVPALQYSSVANVLTIYASSPFVIAAIAWAWLGERPAMHTLAASVLATAGLIMMLGGPGSVGLHLGDLLAIAGTLITAMMTVEARRSATTQMLPATLLANVLVLLATLPFAGALLHADARDWIVLVLLAWCGASIGLVLYLTGSSLIPAALTALLSTVSVPAGVALAWIGVGEAPTRGEIVGACAVLAGVIGALLLEQRAAPIAVARRAGADGP
jgi:drug/metabolite transporter (DMT)-like permease